MKVSELIEMLKGIDPDTKVLVSSDPEGNGFLELHTASEELAVNDGYYYELISYEDEEEESVPNEEPVIVLWP